MMLSDEFYQAIAQLNEIDRQKDAGFAALSAKRIDHLLLKYAPPQQWYDESDYEPVPFNITRTDDGC